MNKTGLIFYTHDRFQHDWIVISLVDGKLIVEQKFGRTKSSERFDQSINDDKWYKIVFKRRSSIITELALYSVALRNVENRMIKSKTLNYVPFTSFNRNSFVYLGGLPKNFLEKYRPSTGDRFPAFQGYIRNLRYGLCGCPERIQYPVFSSLSSTRRSEVCEEQISLCSSSSCECLNVDEEPRYQCDCSNKTCHIITQMSKWFTREKERERIIVCCCCCLSDEGIEVIEMRPLIVRADFQLTFNVGMPVKRCFEHLLMAYCVLSVASQFDMFTLCLPD